MTSIRIAYIGGGSRYWARDLMADLALGDKVTGTIALHDIDHGAAMRNVSVGRAIFARPEARSRFEVRAVRRLEEALQGADFVVLSTEPGPVSLRHADLEIPAAHGIVQPVGDTTGPGGILRALRSIPTYLEFGQAIGKCCPEAWVINYTNPMTLCTAALHAAFPGIRAFGCCHEVYGTQARLAAMAGRELGVETPHRSEIELDVSGVNHFTWAMRASWKGTDLFPLVRSVFERKGFFDDATRIADENARQEKWFHSQGKISFDLFRRFGALGAAGDRHLAEFVPWYLSNGEAGLRRWGVVSTPYAWRARRLTERDADPSEYARRPLRPSGEEGVAQIEALLGLGEKVTNVNLPNVGQAPDLPIGHVVETYARFSKQSIRPLVAAALPFAVHPLVTRVTAAQALTLRAGIERDASIAFQALLNDPLMSLPTDKAAVMFRDMLQACRGMLRGWKTSF